MIINFLNNTACFSLLKASLADLRPANLCIDASNGEQTAFFGANHVKLILR